MKMKAKLSRTLKKRSMVDVAPHVDDDEDSGGSNCFICGFEDYFENQRVFFISETTVFVVGGCRDPGFY